MSYFRQYRPVSGNRMPFGILNLIVLNVIFFVAKTMAWSSRSLDLDEYLGLYHPMHQDFHFFQFVTSLFMHGDIGHLAFNMLGLWMFGHMLENALGLKRFLIFYLVSGIGACLIYLGWTTWNAVEHLNQFGDGWSMLAEYPPRGVLIGASGAVYGLLMGAALFFPNTEVYYLGFMGFPIKLKWLAVIYGGAELMRGWSPNPQDNVAHFAHIGGMIFGFILVQYFKRDRSNFY